MIFHIRTRIGFLIFDSACSSVLHRPPLELCVILLNAMDLVGRVSTNEERKSSAATIFTCGQVRRDGVSSRSYDATTSIGGDLLLIDAGFEHQDSQRILYGW